MACRTLLRPPSKTPYILSLVSVTMATSAGIEAYQNFVFGNGHRISSLLAALSALSLATSLVILTVCVSYPMTDVLPSPTVAPLGSRPSHLYSSPEDAVSLWNWMTFNYINPILDRAGEGTLNEEDVWDLPPGFKHSNLFRKYLKVMEKNPKMPLVWFLLQSNSQDLVIDFSLKLYTSVAGIVDPIASFDVIIHVQFAGFVPPYALSRILSSLEDRERDSHADAYLFAFVAFVAHMTFAQLDLLQSWHSRRAYERTRGQLFCALHWKALKAKDARGKVSAEEGKGDSKGAVGIGRITNLMS